MMKTLTISFAILIVILACTSNLNSQTTSFSITTNSFLRAKAESTVTQDTELFGSNLESRRTLTYEIFANASFRIKDKLSTYIGLGAGYFNAAYRIKITDDFLNNGMNLPNSFRVSSSVSNYYALKAGISKYLYASDRSNLQLSVGGRVYYAETGETEFGLGRRFVGGIEMANLVTKESTNANKELDFSVDLGLIFQKQIRNSPLYWSVGLTYSQALTELWSGEAELNGSSGSYVFNTTNKLSFIGFELGIIYKLKPKSSNHAQ